MNPLHINYVKKEAAPNQGKAKSRIHLYDYKGPKGKDVFAIAATLYKGKGAPRLNCIQKLFSTVLAVEKAGKTKWFIVNTRSLKKRLKITSSELKGVSPQGLAALINGKLQPNLEARKEREPTSPSKNEIKEPKTPVEEKPFEKAPLGAPVPQDPQVQGLDPVKGYFDEKDWPFIMQMVNIAEKTKKGIEKRIEELKNGPSKDETLTLYRIGCNLIRLNKKNEAEEYFAKALQQNSNEVVKYQNVFNKDIALFSALVNTKLPKKLFEEATLETLNPAQRLSASVSVWVAIKEPVNGAIDGVRERLAKKSNPPAQ